MKESPPPPLAETLYSEQCDSAVADAYRQTFCNIPHFPPMDQNSASPC